MCYELCANTTLINNITKINITCSQTCQAYNSVFRYIQLPTPAEFQHEAILYATDGLINGALVMIALSIERFNASVFESLVGL